MQGEKDVVLDTVKHRLATDPDFRREVTRLLQAYDGGEQSIDTYLDRTLKSPRLRALFERSQAKTGRSS